MEDLRPRRRGVPRRGAFSHEQPRAGRHGGRARLLRPRRRNEAQRARRHDPRAGSRGSRRGRSWPAGPTRCFPAPMGFRSSWALASWTSDFQPSGRDKNAEGDRAVRHEGAAAHEGALMAIEQRAAPASTSKKASSRPMAFVFDTASREAASR